MRQPQGTERKVEQPEIITFSVEGETLIGTLLDTVTTQFGQNFRLKDAYFGEGEAVRELSVCVVGHYVALQPFLQSVPFNKVVKIVFTGERKSSTTARNVHSFQVSYFE